MNGFHDRSRHLELLVGSSGAKKDSDVGGINLDHLSTLRFLCLVLYFALMSHLNEVSQQFVSLSVGLLHLLELVSQSHTVGLQ